MNKLLFSLCFLIILSSCKKTDYMPVVRGLPTSKIFELNRIDQIFFTNDKGLLISGDFNNKTTLIKTDLRLNILWTKGDFEWGYNYTEPGWGGAFHSSQILHLFQKNDGNYICIAGIEEGGCIRFSSTFIEELNQKGNQIKQIKIESFSPWKAIKTSDEGYLLLGNKLIKLDKYLDKKWEKELNHNEFSESQIRETSNGFASTGSYGYDKVFLRKYDSEGNITSTKVYDHPDYPFNDAGYDLIQLADKGFLIAGRTRKIHDPLDTDCQLIRTNNYGDTIWTKRFGDASDEWLENILESDQNEFIIQGNEGFPNSTQKSILLKINSNGQILDYIKTDKFEKIVRSPLNYYLKAQKYGSNQIKINYITKSEMFNMQ